VITEKVRSTGVATLFDQTTQTTSLALVRDPPATIPAPLSSEESWEALHDGNCDLIDDLEIVSMLLLLDHEIDVLTEAMDIETDDDRATCLYDAIEEHESDRRALEEELNRREAAGILATRKRAQKVAARVQTQNTPRTGEVHRDLRATDVPSYVTSNASAGESNVLLPLSTILELPAQPIPPNKTKIKRIVVRKHATKRTDKKQKRVRILIEY
jgi:hypothetical protein